MGVSDERHADATAVDRFRKVYRRHHHHVLAYALRRCDDEADAHDVVADTFTVAWRRLEDVPPGDDALPWLYGVARNCWLNQRRSRRRLLTLVSRIAQEGAPQPQPARSHDERSPLLLALAQLTESDQEVLRLAVWEELTNAEIARALDVSVTAVASRLHRARRRLRDALEELWEGGAEDG